RDLAGPMTGKNGRHPLPDPKVFAKRLSSIGVSSDSQVVFYDGGDGMYAARGWWMLRWVGHDAVAVLNGGWDMWKGESRPISKEIPTPRLSTFSPATRSVTVDASFVLSHLHSPDIQLIDARANDRFNGQNETMDPVAGHIPGALNRPFRSNLDEQGRF